MQPFFNLNCLCFGFNKAPIEEVGIKMEIEGSDLQAYLRSSIKPTIPYPLSYPTAVPIPTRGSIGSEKREGLIDLNPYPNIEDPVSDKQKTKF